LGVWNGTTRVGIVVFGGLLTLQSSDRLDAVKLAYLVVAGIAVTSSVIAVWRARHEPLTLAIRPWLVASVVVLMLVAVSLPVALLNGTSPTNWLRDAAAYAILGAAPWLAVDLARSVPTRAVLAGLLVAGLLSVASYGVMWVQRRHLADLPIDRLTFPSMTLGAAAYCVAIASAVRSRGRTRVAWTLLSMTIIAAFLMTGSRASFALLAGPIAVALVDVWQRGRAGLRDRAVPVIAQVATVGVVVFATIASVAPSTDPTAGTAEPSSKPSRAVDTTSPPGPDLEDRFLSIDDVVAGRDQSLQMRIQQTQTAWVVFSSSPLVGVGLGYQFPFMRTPTTQIRISYLDTPASIIAKFGVLGLLLVGVLAGAFLLVIRAMIRRDGTSWRALTMVAYGAILLALTPLGQPLEDKGTGLALVFLLALVATDSSDSQRDPA
jgi:hypothetical protein